MDNAMYTDSSATGTFQRQLPKDLLQEVARTHAGPPDDMDVAWQPSLIGRFLDLFAGRRSR